MNDRGMGRCRFCSESPSNVDHDGLVLGIRHVVICGAWAHYMLEHNVTLAPSYREKVLAIKPGTFSGKTLAYRSIRGVDDAGTLRIFFVEEDDGIHTRGQAVDVELFNHVRLLALKCQATDVPPALPEVVGNVAGGGAVPLGGFDALLALFQQSLKAVDLAEWRVMAGQACRRLNRVFSGIDLSELAAMQKDALRQLIYTAFAEAGFESKVINVSGGRNPAGTEPVAQDTIGIPPGGAYNLEVYTDGVDIRVYFFPVPSEYDQMRS